MAADTSDRTAGLLLMTAAAAALVIANSPFADTYDALLHANLGPLTTEHWIADALMSLFFLLVGLEVKREWLAGRLSTPTARRLPLVAAAAGIVVPALVYLAATGGDPALTRGWAIPAATDIAFALGVLALLGTRAPPALKLLLVTIAIVDDIGAILIIAVFYTASLDLVALVAAAAILAGMALLNRLRVRTLWPYLAGFVLLWLAVHASGIHATVAGVLAALTVPLGEKGRSPVRRLENHLHEWVMFGIVPLFGLASAGVVLGRLEQPNLSAAVAFGLVLGKPIGVLGVMWLADRSGFAPRPASLSWRHLAGAALLCGIGFTMSLFIGALAFPDPALHDAAKLGTLAGSAVAGLLGFLALRGAPALASGEADREEVRAIFGEDQEPDR